jgi:tRNA splicing endonuclease
MAVYQGARRPMGFVFPWSRTLEDAPDLPAPVRRAPARRVASLRAPGSRAASARGAIRAKERSNRVGATLAGIMIVFSAAFLSLTQSVRVAATSYDIVRLVSEQDRLAAQEQDLRSDLQRLRSQPAIRKGALDRGLGQLGASIVLPAR